MPRREPNAKIRELKSLPVFAGLSEQRLERIATFLDEVTVPAGEKMLTEGRHNDTFWILLEGEAELTVAGRARETLNRGDVVGMPSMFTHLVSTADVLARTPIRAFVASHAQFHPLVSDPEIEIRFKAAVFDRLRDEVRQLEEALAKRKSTAKQT